MNAATAAKETRKAIKAEGINPKGMVRVINTSYTTEVEVDFSRVYGEAQTNMEDFINNLEDDGTFSWNII